MDWKNKLYRPAFALIGALVLVIAGCSIRYSPNGGALDYTQLKTITIGEVINKAPIVNPILASSLHREDQGLLREPYAPLPRPAGG